MSRILLPRNMGSLSTMFLSSHQVEYASGVSSGTKRFRDSIKYGSQRFRPICYHHGRSQRE